MSGSRSRAFAFLGTLTCLALQMGDAGAQIADDLLDRARGVTVNGRTPIAFYAVEQRGSWTLNAIYSHTPEPDGQADASYWMIRRTSAVPIRPRIM